MWKKEFSVVYIKNYKLIWKNHIKNQDDTVSLTDLTVQIFTVTSLVKNNIRLQTRLFDWLIDPFIFSPSIWLPTLICFTRFSRPWLSTAKQVINFYWEWLFAHKSPHVVQLNLRLNAHKLMENLPNSKKIKKKTFPHRLWRVSKARKNIFDFWTKNIFLLGYSVFW